MSDPVSTITAGLSILDKALRLGGKAFGARQLCWLCILSTAGGGFFFATRYATSAELFAVQVDVSELQVASVEKDLIDTRIIQCISVTGSKRWYIDRISALQRKYRKMTGSTYDLPACEDL